MPDFAYRVTPIFTSPLSGAGPWPSSKPAPRGSHFPQMWKRVGGLNPPLDETPSRSSALLKPPSRNQAGMLGFGYIVQTQGLEHMAGGEAPINGGALPSRLCRHVSRGEPHGGSLPGRSGQRLSFWPSCSPSPSWSGWGSGTFRQGWLGAVRLPGLFLVLGCVRRIGVLRGFSQLSSASRKPQPGPGMEVAKPWRQVLWEPGFKGKPRCKVRKLEKCREGKSRIPPLRSWRRAIIIFQVVFQAENENVNVAENGWTVSRPFVLQGRGTGILAQ